MKKQWIDSRKCLLTLRGIGFGLLLFGGLMTPGYSQTLTHRYDFKMPDDGMSVNDLVGSANGFLYGTGNFDGLGKLNLLGIDGYVDLGPDLISSSSSLTIEAWVDFGGSTSWSRLFDIGDTDEITGKGCYGMDFVPYNGSGINQFEVFDADPGSDHAETLTFTPSLNNQTNTHLVITYDPDASNTCIYVNGALAASSSSITIPISSLHNAHTYLGRSGYNGDPYLTAALDEFRIYDGVISAAQVAFDYASGPDTIVTDPGTLTNIIMTLPSPIYVDQTGIQVKIMGDFTNLKGVNLSFVNPVLTSGDTNILTVGEKMTVSAKAAGTTTLIATYASYSVTQSVTVISYPATLTHRYKFDESVGSTTFADSVGTADGLIIGTASLDGNGNLILPGGTDNYGELPANLIDGYDALTFEFWLTVGSNPTWGRLIDFGDTDVGGNGVHCIDCTPHSGFSPNGVNWEVNGASGTESLNVAPILDGQNVHLVLIFNPLNQSLAMYTNGVLMGRKTGVSAKISDLVDNHCWLGKSSYAADSCGVDTINEFRIYNGALSPFRVALNAASGPSTVIDDPGSLKKLNLSIGSDTAYAYQSTTATVTGDFANVQGLNLAFTSPAITSSDTNVIQIDGMTIKAIGKGTATVTAYYGGLSSSKTITVLESSATLMHRYSFNETAENTSFSDSVGSANGTLYGAAYLDGNGSLVLPGGSSGDYAELPANLTDAYDGVTFELWVTVGSNPTWGRLVDFGDTDESGNGVHCMDCTPHSGFSPNGINWEVNGANGTESLNVAPVLDGQNVHLVLVFNPQAQYLAIYTNGVIMGIKMGITTKMTDLVANHCWLGKSSYTADTCGIDTIDEFRIYNGALSSSKIAADYIAGPSSVPVVETAPKLSIIRNGNKVVLTWPIASNGYTVQTTSALGVSTSWEAVTEDAAIIQTNGMNQITLTLGTKTAFFRLAK